MPDHTYNMQTDYHLHYWGYQLRDAPVNEKMTIILAEIITPTTALRGYSELLGMKMLEYGQVSSQLENFQIALFNLSSQMLDMRNAEMGKPITEDSFNQFIGKITPIIDKLTTLIEEVSSIKAEMIEVYPEKPDLSELFWKYIHHIWATIDIINNPNLVLPDYIIDWLDNRDELWERVHAGDLEVVGIVEKDLDNPLEQIRSEAQAMLNLLNHPE